MSDSQTRNGGIKLLNEGIPVIKEEMWGCRYGRTLTLQTEMTIYVTVSKIGGSTTIKHEL